MPAYSVANWRRPPRRSVAGSECMAGFRRLVGRAVSNQPRTSTADQILTARPHILIQFLAQYIDLEKPNAARVYDYLLGGGCNFEQDRRFAEKFLEIVPNVDRSFRANRAFLRRAVRFCVDAGIRQFLDIGSGIPTVGNVHEIAQEMAPECRVVYVDNEPVAVAHSEAILEGNDKVSILQADLSDPGTERIGIIGAVGRKP
jgi:hypothetical protein